MTYHLRPALKPTCVDKAQQLVNMESSWTEYVSLFHITLYEMQISIALCILPNTRLAIHTMSVCRSDIKRDCYVCGDNENTRFWMKYVNKTTNMEMMIITTTRMHGWLVSYLQLWESFFYSHLTAVQCARNLKEENIRIVSNFCRPFNFCGPVQKCIDINNEPFHPMWDQNSIKQQGLKYVTFYRKHILMHEGNISDFYCQYYWSLPLTNYQFSIGSEDYDWSPFRDVCVTKLPWS